jgi:hypothetical protein
MWVSGSADWPAAERQLIISRLGANRLPVRWASWQSPSLGNRRGKSYAGLQSAGSYRPGTYISGRPRWASAPRSPAARRWEAFACFQAKVAGWLPGG